MVRNGQFNAETQRARRQAQRRKRESLQMDETTVFSERKGVRMSQSYKHVHFEVFKSSFKSWESLFAEAAAYAEGVGSERLIGISHSEDQNKGVVTVWYWSGEPRSAE